MSANMKYPKILYKEKLAITKPIVYAKGSLVILSNTPRDFSKGIYIVNDSKINKIAIANPKTAPYGMATKEALKNINLFDKIKNKFVYAESISQALAYTNLSTDIGFVAKSAFNMLNKSNKYKEGIHWIDLDETLYTKINQGIVILDKGKNNKSVKEFYDFILSNHSKKILEKHGYHIQ